MIKVGIIGATGYTGEELIRLLVTRSDIELTTLTSRNEVGTKVQDYYPHFKGLIDQSFVAYDPNQIFDQVDVLFLCLPHGVSMEIAKAAQAHDVKVIDLGADFRLKDSQVYQEYYAIPQTEPDLLEQAVYGLPELYAADIQKADLIANPGCFVTCSLLALLPVIDQDFIRTDSVIIDAKTGVSGAGRSAKVANLLTELANNFYAYNPMAHRHIPEIEQTLNNVANNQVSVQFTPHLLPTERGIHATIYVDLTKDINEDQVRQIYQNYYQDKYFIHILGQDQLPQIKAVRASNFAQIQVKVDQRTNRLVIFAVIDNLVKGAAGQAIQNMNLMFGLDQTTGLTQAPIFP
ncbi:MAG TPA: N-acetyl-gamma-glutamyl-phosphate reductase [Aerococcus urinaeequi]|nr:N-acetyl-gamma-glutamyl-phosphate reductase [Aerococcus urinaeequi]